MDAWGRRWTPRCPDVSPGLLRRTVVDLCGRGNPSEKRKIGGPLSTTPCGGARNIATSQVSALRWIGHVAARAHFRWSARVAEPNTPQGAALHLVPAVARTPYAALERREGGHREHHHVVLRSPADLARADGGGVYRRDHRSPVLRTLGKESRTALGHRYTAPGGSWRVRFTVGGVGSAPRCRTRSSSGLLTDSVPCGPAAESDSRSRMGATDLGPVRLDAVSATACSVLSRVDTSDRPTYTGACAVRDEETASPQFGLEGKAA